MFQACKFIIHLYIVTCAHNPKSSLFVNTYLTPFTLPPQYFTLSHLSIYPSKIINPSSFMYLFFKKEILFIFREKEKDRDRNINVWLPLACPLLGTWPATRACATTENWTSNSLVHRPMLHPLSNTNWGYVFQVKCGHQYISLKNTLKYM